MLIESHVFDSHIRNKCQIANILVKNRQRQWCIGSIFIIFTSCIGLFADITADPMQPSWHNVGMKKKTRNFALLKL